MKKGSILLILAAFLWFLAATNRLDASQEALGKQRLEEALRQTAAACYAAEGVYPPGVAYMEVQYGLRFDKDRYTVHYSLFGSNLMPEITVLEAAP